jgi:hypothetical protein
MLTEKDILHSIKDILFGYLAWISIEYQGSIRINEDKLFRIIKRISLQDTCHG